MDTILLYLGDDLELFLRMLVAAVCGGVIGYERSRRRKEAGLRTHIIVALGSAILMIVSKYGFMDIAVIPGMRADGSRIASNVVTGISFLGAGVIFVRNDSIKGLTTAAGLWSVTGIGLAIGAGLYSIGIFATILIVVIHFLTHGHLKRLEGITRETISITYQDSPNGLERLKKLLQDKDIQIHHIRIEKNLDRSITATFDISRDRVVNWTDFAELFIDDPSIKSFKL